MFAECLIKRQQIFNQEIILLITIFGHIGYSVIAQTEIIDIFIRCIPFKGEIRSCIQTVFKS